MVNGWRRLTRITNHELEKKLGYVFQDAETVTWPAL